MSDKTRPRLGPLAVRLMEEEAGEEKPNGSHLDAAIARLQVEKSNATMLLEISESILRLRSMIMASVLTDHDEVDKAMKQLHDAIGKDMLEASRSNGQLDQNVAEVDRQLVQQVEQSFLPARSKQLQHEDRER